MDTLNQATGNDQALVTETVPANDSPVAQQPCSGTLVVRSSAFGAGASAASPDVVCSIKRAS